MNRLRITLLAIIFCLAHGYIEATLLDANGKPLCSAFYVTVVKTESTYDK